MNGVPPMMLLAVLPVAASAVDWVRPSADNADLRWGVKGRLNFAIPPTWGGPRGLIRILCPTLKNGGYDLINFIAIEPIVADKRGFSELEGSGLDHVQGKRIWAPQPAGTVSKLENGAEVLSVRLDVEAFENGAHVYLTASIRSDRPDQLRLKVNSAEDSKAIDFGILTATMGNKARARSLWLGDGCESSLKLWPEFGGNGFAQPRSFPAARMLARPGGGLMAAITTDELHPSEATMQPGSEGWAYLGKPMTQYWLKPNGKLSKGLVVVVNARATYWGNHKPIPGGQAFENFELNEPFADGQEFVFGVTTQSPEGLGFRSTR